MTPNPILPNKSSILSSSSAYRANLKSLKIQDIQDIREIKNHLNQLKSNIGPLAPGSLIKQRRSVIKNDQNQIILPVIKPAPKYNHQKNTDIIFEAIKKTKY